MEKQSVEGEVTHGAIRTLPHLLQFEFLYPGFIRSDGCAFDSDVVLEDGLGRVDRDLVVGLEIRETTSAPGSGSVRAQFYAGETEGTYGVSGLKSEVVVLDVEVEVWKNELQWISFGTCAHIAARESPKPGRTSSRIFFQMILVISSPSSSTTGFATAIFVSGGRNT